MNKDELQIVVIDDLHALWNNLEVRRLYCDLVGIKLEGYSQVYGENVISADKADFFGTHLMVCKKDGKNRLKPLFGYKSVTLEQCDHFHLKFPALSLVGQDAKRECLAELTNIINSAQERGETISFDYSWAQDPLLKENRSPEDIKMFRDLVMVLVLHHHRTYKIQHMITCGVVKVKTDLFFEKMGMNKISKSSRFSQKDLNHEDVHIFHASKFSQYAQDVAELYKGLWGERIEFSKVTEKLSKKAA